MAAILAVASGASVALIPTGTVVLSSGHVRLKDVAAPVSIPRSEWERMGSLVIATTTADGRDLTVWRPALTRLIMRRVPALTVVSGAGRGAVSFRVPPSARRGPGQACAQLTVSRAIGQIISRDDIRPGECASPATTHVRRDAVSGEVVAVQELPAGSNLGRVVLPPAVAARKGDALRLVSRVGPIEIERPVTAMQSARPDRRVFVRDPDGAVFAVRLDQHGVAQ